jgi:hypothetical protein
LFGLGQVDVRSTVQVVECRAGDPGCAPASNGQPGGANPDAQQLDAYRRLGQGLVGGGVGGWLPITERSGVHLELSVLYAFPTQGLVVSPSLSYLVQVR